MKNVPNPQPLFDSFEHRSSTLILTNAPEFAYEDFSAAHAFLKQYDGNKATFEAYRREIERLVQWSWYLAKKSLLLLKRQDIEDYLAFCLNPPKAWISLKRVPRFITVNGERKANPTWRPFVASVNKYEHKAGIKPDKSKYHLSQKAIREIFTVLSSFYNFLAIEDKIAINPIQQIKQKSKYLQKSQKQSPVMRLSEHQWQTCLDVARELALANPKHERTLFILSALYLLYLRVSELAASNRWTPQMKHFYQDSNGHWWFKTVGKGNKVRDIAVSDTMLEALKRYRHSMGLPALPAPNESHSLIPKEKGRGPTCSTRRIRQIVQTCFDKAILKLRDASYITDADALEIATTHWLRHTGISDDINKRNRPVAHVRDDAGHSTSAITDRYNDIELKERYLTAKEKKL